MRQENNDASFEDFQEINNLMREGVRIACSTTDFPLALKRFTEAFPPLAPNMKALAAPDDAEAQRTLCFMLFREIWNRVPRPDHGFHPLPLPKQERNEPCQCGSGRKFKQCCAKLEDELPFDPKGLSLLGYVLEDMPTSAYEKLPFNYLSPEELAFVAGQWVATGRADLATFLLVPLLSQVKKLDARHETAFDTLGDAYLELGMPEQRIELVERMMKASDPTLRCAALHRRCTIDCDVGDWTAAWKTFAKAERLQPDNPALSHLEVVMLASEGRTAEAQARARYWMTRLARQGLISADDPLIDFLRMMSDDPEAVLAMIRGQALDDFDDEEVEWLMPLIGMLETLPEPACHYMLHPVNGDAGELEADQQLAALEQQWREVLPDDMDDPFGESEFYEQTEWIGWLTRNPLAWQSFAVLADVAAFIDNTPLPDGFEDTSYDMAVQLLTHAVLLLEVVIADNKAQGCRLAWGWLENRPALRLLASHIETVDDSDEELRLLEWLVGTLNPNDNQGLRESLARLLLDKDRALDVLALCERYPDDGLAATPYARVLALHQLGRLDEAAAALAVARQSRPKILSLLIADCPQAPELDFDSVTVGGDDEAWYYLMDWLPSWTRSGALDWLKRTASPGQ
jgi:tetratricopeptide (TPR) repeat protein